MRTVAKALRCAAKGKAFAQAEAAEWKRKYELERTQNLQLEHKENPTLEVLFTPTSHNAFLVAAAIENLQPLFSLSSKRLWVFHSQAKNFVKSFAIGGLKVLSHIDASIKENLVDVFTEDNFPFYSLKKQSLKEHHDERMETLASQSSMQPEYCCGRNGICSLEVLRDGEADSDPNFLPNNKFMRKASFKLSWWCKGEHSDQHKHDIVSFERGNIPTAEHSCRQMLYALPKTATKAAYMYKGPIPPVVPFSLGSLGFYDPFLYPQEYHTSDSEHYRECLDSVLKGPITITLHHRLQCHVIGDDAKNEYETEEPILVLNEVTINRGISSYLVNSECYCDNSFVRSVQGDGLILSTTSGSTAYSLAAGGSMVHPQLPGILFTPICPHSLSFCPLILPEHVTIGVQVPFNCRSQAWASFDGKDRKQLKRGDALVCSMAPWPVPTACLVDSTNDFLRSLHQGLHWTLRKAQSFDGPRDSS
ncbi:hypothetical protein FEM48_Zijuj05G0182400 [Ziziphus jujuba var. spinosa]|uniref:NAD(H) kinase 1 n=1 Tax=Ziziphus jujuba var. spinosa TaxID=714518 RepID=A0A978VGD3_ZIZJJ|nr:hypothetical protein FEM48_Zijuj05G0182400 [Ziziphus jujuba var. spinosa]